MWQPDLLEDKGDIMSEQNYAYGINWSTYGQAKLEIESELRCKISKEISEYAEYCRERGMSTYFTSGLELAANMALFSAEERNNQLKEENLS
jgi:hypothetical protein